jgi:hypothetical protein
MIRIPQRDRPESDYILLSGEEERMLEHKERVVNRLLDLMRVRYARVTVTAESERNGGVFGVEQFIVSLSLRGEREGGETEDFVTEIDIGSATRDGDEGYFSASMPSDESLENMLLVVPLPEDPRQKMLFARD